MLIAYEGLFLVQICLLVYCVFNIITTPAESCRNLPKIVWLLLAILFPIVGGIAWLVAGRPQSPRSSGLPYKGNRGIPPEYDRPGRASAASPDDDAAFLAHLKQRAEEQRKRAAEDARRIRDEEQPPPV